MANANMSVGNNSLTANYNCWDDPGGVMNYQTAKNVFRTVSCGFLPSLFLVGAPTNIITMIVFYRQGLRDRMNFCLFCLASSELSYITAVFIKVSFCFVGIFLPEDEDFWRWTLSKHTLNFIYGFSCTSGCLTMIISVERCVCVMFPMKAATLISTKTMAVIVIITFLLTQGLCGVYIVKDKVSYVKDTVTGKYRIISAITELYQSSRFLQIIENIVISFVSFFTYTVVLLATIVTVTGLRNAISWRKSTSRSQLKGQALLMRMLVVVSCVYILCTAPNVALALARFLVPEFRVDGPYCNLFQSTHYVALLTAVFHSSVNFFVYVTMSSRFRRELKTAFTPNECYGLSTLQSDKVVYTSEVTRQ